MRWLLFLLIGCDGGPSGPPGGVIHIEATQAFASFARKTGKCSAQISMIGPCASQRHVSCTKDGGASSAGIISLAWTEGQTNQYVTLTPGDDHQYWIGGLALPEGARVSVEAGGDTVPPFQSEVTMPSPPPMISGFGIGTIDRSKDLSLTWEPRGSMNVFVSLYQGANDPGIDCEFGADTGEGTIPAAALQLFSAGTGEADADTGTIVDTTAGDWSIRLSAAAVIPIDSVDGSITFN